MSCSDCLKGLFSPWISIPNILLVLSGVFVLSLIWPEENAPAWVQAFGSIAAIIGAAWFPYLHEARKAAGEVKALESRIGGLSLHLCLIIDEMQGLLGPSEIVPAYDHTKIEIIAAELNREICGVALEEKGLVTIADLIMLRAAADQATRIATRIAKTIQTRGAVNLFDKEPELRRFYLMMKSTRRELKPVVEKLT